MPTGSPGYWTSDMDYPAGAVRRKEEGTVGFAMLIDPNGKVGQCLVTESSGFPELDQVTCGVMLVRGKFKPGRDENGKPIYDRYKGFLTWRLPGKGSSGRTPMSRVNEPDMILEVQQLPQGEKEHIVSVVARTDDQGRVAYCEASPNGKSLPQLVATACAQLKSAYTAELKDETGNSLPAIQAFRIAFRVRTQ
jgi:TonB family protein